ncbi:MAG: uroporphyrinogen decarboxylase family protein [Bacteroidota bacterium]|nr:uroporphyrinogen decarboxylase family protein [Bacteroidota bacterium]
MNRSFYLDLARKGSGMVLATDLVLKEKANPEALLNNGVELGKIILESADRYDLPLAFPFMDLSLEKQWLLTLLGIEESKIEKFHFDRNIDESIILQVEEKLETKSTARVKATCDALRYVAENSDKLTVGMCIGPFSLMTKLITEPITPVFLAAMGEEPSDDASVRNVEIVLQLAELIISQYIRMQIAAGAQAICICEPAANKIYISPDVMMEDEADIFDRYVISIHKRLKKIMSAHDVDLIFHDCGDITPLMLKKISTLHPVILSLGSPVRLWHAVSVVPKDIVLFGNLPTKQFFMDETISPERVEELSNELLVKMKETGHPFILGSECDVLSVNGYEKTIQHKINIMLNCCKHWQ